MKQIVFIVGLPGSGKTSLAQQIVEPGDVLLDDFSNDPESAITEAAGCEGRIIITDPKACFVEADRVHQKLYEFFGEALVEIIAFQNDPEACWANLLRRNDDRIISKAYLTTMSRKYYPTHWSEDIRPVYRG